MFHHQGTKTPKDPIPEETDRVAREIVDAAFKVHRTLGPGLLEGVYEKCLIHELTRRGLKVRSQIPVSIDYGDLRLAGGLRLDLVVKESVVVELKSIERFLPVHLAQLLTYLRLSKHRLGLLINFNVAVFREGVKRVAL